MKPRGWGPAQCNNLGAIVPKWNQGKKPDSPPPPSFFPCLEKPCTFHPQKLSAWKKTTVCADNVQSLMLLHLALALLRKNLGWDVAYTQHSERRSEHMFTHWYLYTHSLTLHMVARECCIPERGYFPSNSLCSTDEKYTSTKATLLTLSHALYLLIH